ncbi:MAG: DUF4340 domain-containing protein [Oscillospiraceae bacterium]|nr:DUF4340 domain-containing protein [Oscillospiraceae bacterium]
MKKRKQLIALLGVLAVLCLLYFGAVSLNNGIAAKAQAESEAQAQASRIVLTDMDAAQIAYENGTDQLSFYKQDDEWYYQADKDFPLAQSYLTKLEGLCAQLDAVRALDNGDTLAAYGLENPKYRITITDKDQTQKQLLIGNATNEQYYCKLADDDTVYTIQGDLVECLKYSVYDMIELDTIPAVTSDTLQALSITNPQGSYTLKKVVTEKEAEVPAKDESDAYTTTSQEVTWTLADDGTEQTVQNTALMDTVLTALQSFKFSSCIDYKGAENTTLMQESGLDAPIYSITLTYTDTAASTENQVTIYAGNTRADESVYAKLSSKTAVNTVSSDTLLAIAGALTKDFLSKS